MRTWLGLLPLLLCVSSCSSIRVARVSPTSKKAALRAQAAKIEEDEEEEEGEEDEAAPAEWNRMRRAIPETGEIPADRALAAARALEAMPRISASNRLSGKDRDAAAGTGVWEPLGPGNVGGRTRSLLIHPTNPNILYAGAVTGGEIGRAHV
mgnify:FL=1